MSDAERAAELARFHALFYPGTTVLQNKYGLRDADELHARERHAANVRAVELRTNPGLIPRSHDLAQLQAIHRHLFQDVYAWAGEVREFNIAKGGKPFAHYGNIQRYYFAGIEYDLRQHDNGLRSADRDTFALAAADLFANVNQAHPFREGNGRSTRMFIESVIRDVAPHYQLNLRTAAASKEAWNDASHQSRPDVDHLAPDPTPLLDVFRAATHTRTRQRYRSLDRGSSASAGYGAEL
ncbi:Fic/DOC family protein [Tsukamurella hominis]|uniref:Fic/DOC family protein n=1 Tax=Tsukamurella hominis TaxID=1970232 RepID=UPI0039EB1DFA